MKYISQLSITAPTAAVIFPHTDKINEIIIRSI